MEKKPGASAKKRFHGDASKVVAKGNGLKKTFAGNMTNITVDVKDAGTWESYSKSGSKPSDLKNLD